MNITLFLQEDLKPYLLSSRFHCDAMHCYWSNGAVNCEIGLFFTEASRLVSLTRTHLTDFLQKQLDKAYGKRQYWKSLPCETVTVRWFCRNFRNFTFDGILCYGSVRWVSSFATICAFFETPLASHSKNFGRQAQTLMQCMVWQSCSGCTWRHIWKRTPQRRYVPNTTSVYILKAKRWRQASYWIVFLGNGKNTFKNALAPRIKRLHGFEKAILLRWLEADAESASQFSGDEIILKAMQDTSVRDDIRIAKHLQCQWGEIQSGNMAVWSKDHGMQIIGCIQKTLSLYRQKGFNSFYCFGMATAWLSIRTGSFYISCDLNWYLTNNEILADMSDAANWDQHLSLSWEPDYRFLAGCSDFLWSRWKQTNEEVSVPLSLYGTALRISYYSVDLAACEVWLLR